VLTENRLSSSPGDGAGIVESVSRVEMDLPRIRMLVWFLVLRPRYRAGPCPGGSCETDEPGLTTDTVVRADSEGCLETGNATDDARGVEDTQPSSYGNVDTAIVTPYEICVAGAEMGITDERTYGEGSGARIFCRGLGPAGAGGIFSTFVAPFV